MPQPEKRDSIDHHSKPPSPSRYKETCLLNQPQVIGLFCMHCLISVQIGDLEHFYTLYISIWVFHFYIRRKFSFIRHQHSFKIRSTLQELDKEDVLILSRKEIRDGQVCNVDREFLIYGFIFIALDKTYTLFECNFGTPCSEEAPIYCKLHVKCVKRLFINFLCSFTFWR